MIQQNTGGDVVIRDLHTQHGVFVNDEKIEPGSSRVLQHNDRVRFALDQSVSEDSM